MFMAFGNEHCKEIVENICPFCGIVLVCNKRSFANHIRWCKKNPNYESIKNSTISKLKKNRLQRKEYKVICEVCGNTYNVICTENDFQNRKYRKTCNDGCAKQLTTRKTDKYIKNQKISKSLSKEKLIIECGYCRKKFEAKHSMQKFCCKSCAARYRYHEKTINKYYKLCCSFTFSLNEFPDEYDFSLVQKHGWYKAKNHGDNLYGISRDHIFSCSEGFDNMIDPYIISHPANCQLLQHSDNASKYSKSNISIKELINKIKDWHNKYGVYPNKIDYQYFDKNNIQLNYKINW